MRIAVIDLGTNTCNLLVADVESNEFHILHQSKQLVKLGDNKIRDNEISPAATQRAIQSFHSHTKIISELNANHVFALATSAIRTAANKVAFLEKLGEESGVFVKVISGEKEAELIFKGVLMAFKNLNEASVILDIGGGSNEIILAQNRDVIWKESQPTGMARVINRFNLSDPVSKSQIETLQHFFIEHHVGAIQNCREHLAQTLVGCSGAFDTIVDMIDEVEPGDKKRMTQEISLDEFYGVYTRLIQSTREERSQMKGMDFVRVDLIVPAVILIEKLIREIGIRQIVQTDFALREGVIFEIMEKSVS